MLFFVLLDIKTKYIIINIGGSHERLISDFFSSFDDQLRCGNIPCNPRKMGLVHYFSYSFDRFICTHVQILCEKGRKKNLIHSTKQKMLTLK